jgi:5-methylcytosine-specific restriction endonuclease McrA
MCEDYIQTVSEQVQTILQEGDDVRVQLKQMIDTARRLHHTERRITLESVKLVGILVSWNAAVNANMSTDTFAWHIGLTPDMFYKRAQAGRATQRFPELQNMVERGDASISHLAMVAPHITDANAEVVFAGIRRKSTREVRKFLACLNPDGTLKPEDETSHDLRLTLNSKQLHLLERAQEVLSFGGKIPAVENILEQALERLLDQKDPLRQAERAERRADSKSKASAARQTDDERTDDHVDDTENSKELPATWQNASVKKTTTMRRSGIPKAVRHAVWLRDGGECKWPLADGEVCGHRYCVEIEHIVPKARGGTDEIENLILFCRYHNQAPADEIFGRDYMELYRRGAS